MLVIVLDITGHPINGLSCIITIINPIPFINPEITGYGTYLTITGKEVCDKMICKIPAIIITSITDEISKFRAAIIEAMTIVTGPVIPEINGTLPPIIPAKKHKMIAPQTPALAPNPVATPKANACGSATIAEFKPPKISPTKIFNLDFNIALMIA